MRYPLLICLVSFAFVTIKYCDAAPDKSSPAAISQIGFTLSTGSDASHPKPDPIYKIVLNRDGSAMYVGNTTYIKRTGRYQGTVDKRDFPRLVNLFHHNSFQQRISNRYNRQFGSEKFEVVSGGKRKTVVVYENQEPASQTARRASSILYGLL